MFFFFKQKTAYEMRISDWSSDVCSSDLDDHVAAVEQCQGLALARQAHADRAMQQVPVEGVHRLAEFEHYVLGDVDQQRHRADAAAAPDRKSVGEGKSVAVRVDLGGRRIIKKNKERH